MWPKRRPNKKTAEQKPEVKDISATTAEKHIPP